MNKLKFNVAKISQDYNISNETVSMFVQRELFKLGYKWDAEGNQTLCNQDKGYLYTDEDGIIYYAETDPTHLFYRTLDGYQGMGLLVTSVAFFPLDEELVCVDNKLYKESQLISYINYYKQNHA